MTDKRKETLRALKFTLFSISAGVIQIAVTTLLHELLGMVYWLAYLIGLVCSVVYNFTVNKKFTFHSAANVPVAMAKLFAFYCVFTPLSTLWVKYFTETLGWNEYLVQGGTMLINFVTEYLYTRYFIYRGQVDNDGSGK
ncbi:MAG: GtrA family protein [Oscillospiraceae bacterium]|nr:GtrA family protein [Oscillospiraceae bacterium]